MSGPVLELRGLTKRYGALAATDDLHMDIRPGEIHAVIGPNGAGKTTLIHQISGALRPDGGEILFEGRKVTALSMHQRVALGLARSYQITNIFGRLTVRDNLALAVQARRGGSMRFWRPALSEKALFDEADAIGQRVGLAGHEADIAGTLSHGRQRRLEVGLALATRPRLLLLDEPMAGIGHEESEDIVPLIASLRASMAVLLIEHDMDAVFRVADRISVLVAGRIIATGTPDAIRADADVKRAYLGDEAAP